MGAWVAGDGMQPRGGLWFLPQGIHESRREGGTSTTFLHSGMYEPSQNGNARGKGWGDRVIAARLDPISLFMDIYERNPHFHLRSSSARAKKAEARRSVSFAVSPLENHAYRPVSYFGGKLQRRHIYPFTQDKMPPENRCGSPGMPG